MVELMTPASLAVPAYRNSIISGLQELNKLSFPVLAVCVVWALVNAGQKKVCARRQHLGCQQLHFQGQLQVLIFEYHVSALKLGFYRPYSEFRHILLSC